MDPTQSEVYLSSDNMDDGRGRSDTIYNHIVKSKVTTTLLATISWNHSLAVVKLK